LIFFSRLVYIISLKIIAQITYVSFEVNTTINLPGDLSV